MTTNGFYFRPLMNVDEHRRVSEQGGVTPATRGNNRKGHKEHKMKAARKMQISGMGGTGYQPVFGGNLPPNLAVDHLSTKTGAHGVTRPTLNGKNTRMKTASAKPFVPQNPARRGLTRPTLNGKSTRMNA